MSFEVLVEGASALGDPTLGVLLDALDLGGGRRLDPRDVLVGQAAELARLGRTAIADLLLVGGGGLGDDARDPLAFLDRRGAHRAGDLREERGGQFTSSGGSGNGLADRKSVG